MELLRIEGHVDWITGTTSNEGTRRSLGELSQELLQKLIGEGEQANLWRAHGYEGWRIGPVSYGVRSQDDYLTISGEMANIFHRRASGCFNSISRLDLAVTVWFSKHDVERAARAYEQVKAKVSESSGTRNYTYITNLLGGDTLYVGSRKSQYFGRLYDKWVQSKSLDYINAWRWEMELHKPLAFDTNLKLLLETYQHQFIANTVKIWFEDRFVPCPWDYYDVEVKPIVARRRKTKDEATLEWLEQQIEPSVRKLAAKGKLLQVLKALKISAYLRDDEKDANKRKRKK
jgi:DNA relaxase NicK